MKTIGPPRVPRVLKIPGVPRYHGYRDPGSGTRTSLNLMILNLSGGVKLSVLAVLMWFRPRYLVVPSRRVLYAAARKC
eukprot:2928976-Rhodomonas_salina.1